MGETIVLQTRQASLYRSAGETTFNDRALLRDTAEGLTPRTVVLEAHLPSVQIQDISEAGRHAGAPKGWQRHNFSKYDQGSFVPIRAAALTATEMTIRDTAPFALGNETILGADYRDSAMDAARVMVEECDRLDKLLVVADAVGFWGGLGCGMLELARDEFSPPIVDTFGIFESDGRRGCPADVILNCVDMAGKADRLFPLFLEDALRACEVACMLETYVTGALFAGYASAPVPSGVAEVGFGTADAGAVPPDRVHSLSLSRKWTIGSAEEEREKSVRIGRADGIADLPGYLNVGAYLADPDAAALRSTSAVMALDFSRESALQRYFRDRLLAPLRRQRAVQQQFVPPYSWGDVCDDLERLAQLPVL